MKKFSVILFALMLSLPSFAQGRFGADSAECVKYLSYYSEYMKQNNIEEATPCWRKAISVCPPTANQNLLINGQKILRYEIVKNQRNPQRRQELIDSLIMLHDWRAQYYPKYAGKSLDNKAIDVVNYLKGDFEKQYNILTAVVDNIQGMCSPVVYVTQMNAAVELYKEGKLTAEDVMNNYTKVIGYMETSQNPDVTAAKAGVEQILIDSGVASCDNLIALYTPRFQANPEDKALLTNMVKMLNKSECLDTDLFLSAVEALNKVDPSASSAYYLYKLYSSRGEDANAASSLENAISLLAQDDKATAADYNLELATFYFKKLGRSASAVAYAKKVPELNQALAGKAYLLIGTIWGSQKGSGNEVDVRAPYWVAVDYMSKAKAADPTLAEEADNLSAQYRRYFPAQADAFMYDVIDGQSYNVVCNGMSERTTVRTVK